MSSSIMDHLASDDDQRQRHHDEDTRNSPVLPDDQTFLRAALSLKNQMVEMTWKEKEKDSSASVDPTVYTGLMGTAFTCLRSYQATGYRHDLLLSADIVRTCAAFAHTTRHVTFLCGRGGIYALGAVIANYIGDDQSRGHFVDMFIEVLSPDRYHTWRVGLRDSHVI